MVWCESAAVCSLESQSLTGAIKLWEAWAGETGDLWGFAVSYSPVFSHVFIWPLLHTGPSETHTQSSSQRDPSTTETETLVNWHLWSVHQQANYFINSKQYWMQYHTAGAIQWLWQWHVTYSDSEINILVSHLHLT